MLCAPLDRLARPFLFVAAFLCAAPALADGAALAPPHGPERLTPALMAQPGGAADRVAAASRVRLLAQGFQASACVLHAEIAPEAGRAALFEARREMAHLLDALENGNPALGIEGAETRRKTLRKLHDVRAMWEGMRHSVNALIADGADAAALEEMALFEGILLETSTQLLTEVSGQYSHPFELLQADALAIDIAGRQAMLAERIVHRACLGWMAAETPEQAEEREAAMARLSAGLAALHEGLPELGLRPAPTPRIAAELAALRHDWAVAEGLVRKTAARAATPGEARATLATLAALSARAQAVGADYAAFAKRHH